MQKPKPYPYPGTLERIWLHVRLLIFQSFVRVALFLRRRFSNYPRKTLELSYPQSKLPSWRSPNTVDVYFPGSYYLASAVQKKRPLYIDMHAGGFAVGDPTMDAHFCRYFSDAADCVVISLPYRFAPFTRFPGQIHDLGALVDCVLTDERLAGAIDITKVAIGGFSAGGNFSAAITLLPHLQGRIQALVPIYPVLDFTVPIHEKLAFRPPGRDVLTDMAKMFIAGYISAEQDAKRSDPLLSPLYAQPEELPENIYVVGAELDMLNSDAVNFCKKFGPLKKNLVYEEVKGALHGFTHMAERTKSPEKKAKLEKMTSDVYDRIAEWLTTTVWKTEHSIKPDEQAVEELGGEGVIL